MTKDNGFDEMNKITMTGNKVGEVKVEFPDGDVDVVRVDTEARLSTFCSLFQPLSIGRF